MDYGKDSVGLLAARLEVLVLRGSLPDSANDEPVSFMLPPHRGTLTAEEAVNAMARMPKPLICSINSRANRVLVLDCKTVETAHEVAVYNSDVRSGDRILQSAAEVGRPTSGGRVIMVRRPGETMLVSEDVFVRWSHEYASLAVVALSHGPPWEEEAGEASYVVRVHHVGPPDADSIPPELR